jgi:hypothetical protein
MQEPYDKRGLENWRGTSAGLTSCLDAVNRGPKGEEQDPKGMTQTQLREVEGDTKCQPPSTLLRTDILGRALKGFTVLQ